MNKIYNFLQLTENIATSGQPSEQQLDLVKQAGYEVVINLALTGTDYSLEDEARVVDELGMEYIHLPVIWENPTPADFQKFVEIMQVVRGKKLFIHCAANMRVSVFMALYRILHLGWEREKAMVDVHRIWEPNDTWGTYIHWMLSQDGKGENHTE